MKIVVIGMGVAGSYLTRLIRDDYEVVGYDFSKRRGCECAWGSTRSLLRAKLLNVGLNLRDYELCVPEWGYLNGVGFRVTDGVFFDKRRMIHDLMPEVVFRRVSFEEKFDADLVVNATAKPLLPKPASKREVIREYTVQWMAQLIGAEPKTMYTWFSPKRVGYGWCFPLDEEAKLFHVGAGILDGTVESAGLIKEMLRKYQFRMGKVGCGCSKTLHVGGNFPILEGNVVSVGEAAGCVHPLTGEGVLPSMESAEFLAESLKCNDSLYTYLSKMHGLHVEYKHAFSALETLKRHKRLGMIKVFKVMNERMKNRTKPVVNWKDKLKILWKCLHE